MQAKGGGLGAEAPSGPKAAERIARILDATLNHRRASMTYFSMSSAREKSYLIEPYRLVYSPGGLYLFAFVPEYGEMRTFSVDRIRGISLLEERFTPAEVPEGLFAHSLGVNEGPPEHIEIAFEPRIAPYIRERSWHASQAQTDRKDGGVVLALDVCNDWALRSWILSFGPLARVLSPKALADQIKAEIDRASERYAVE
jgi:predicted DNA-binding transcriptional regulator YafY